MGSVHGETEHAAPANKKTARHTGSASARLALLADGGTGVQETAGVKLFVRAFALRQFRVSSPGREDDRKHEHLA